MASVRGIIDSSDLLSNEKVIDMSDKIADLEPNAAPFTVIMMKMGKAAASNPKFEWMEHRMRANWTQVNNGAGYASGATSIVVDDGSIFAPSDNLKVARTGEILRVTAVATNTLTVTRAFGETAAAAINDNDYFLNLLNASAEASDAPTPVTNNPTALFNYTEIVRTPCKISKTGAATNVYGGTARQRRQTEIGVQHRKALEYKYLFGERNEDTSGSEPVRTTRGLLKWLTQNNKDVSATGILTEYEFDKHLEGIYRYSTSSSTTRTLFSSLRLLTVINQWAKSKMDFVQDDSTYGVAVYKYRSPHGLLNIVPHKLLENTYSGYGFILNMEDVKYRPLNENGINRDTKLHLDLQKAESDFYLDEYLTEAGIEVRLPENHGVIIGVTG